MEALDEHLEIVASRVFDDDKVVTYKWLSKILKIHVNIAKQILWVFYERYHESHDIECTYLIIGLLSDNEMRVEVVKGSELSKAQEKFSKIISEHLYSVHKSLEDLELLANSDPGDVNYSAIKCDACKERNDEEMQLLRWGTVAKKPMTENANTTALANPSRMERNLLTKKNNNESNVLFGKSKNSKEIGSSLKKGYEVSIEKNKSLMREVKCSVEEEDDLAKKNKISIEKNNTTSKDKNLKKVNGLKSLIEKNKNSTVNSCSKKISPKDKPMKNKGLDNFFEKRTSPPQCIKITSPRKNDDKSNTEVVKEIKAKEEKEDLRRRKRNRSKDIHQSAKKRKRVVIQSDSSDSDVQSDVEMENIVPELEETEPPAKTNSSPPMVKHENGKKKVLKLVNKVYKEDGYIITKKEHVYVSCSEDEEEKKEDEERRKVKKVEAKTEKVKKKQSTLTDFFKKS